MGRLGRHAGLRVFRIFTRALGTPDATPAHGCRWLGEHEVLRLCDTALDLERIKVRAALLRGERCVGAFDGNTLAGYCWFAFSATPHLDGAWLDFPAGLAYTYKSYVLPAYRGRGIAGAMYRFGDAAALERGRRTALICVESHNRASVAAALRSGFSPAGYAAYLDGARRFAWLSPAAARLGLRFHPSRPVKSRGFELKTGRALRFRASRGSHPGR